MASTTTIALISTGKLEHAALAESLSRLFSDEAARFEFTVHPPDKPADGLTDTDVTKYDLDDKRNKLRRLAATLVQAVYPLRDRICDFAVVVDDVELVNAHQVPLIVSRFREAVERHIKAIWPQDTVNRGVWETVRNQCSFHLFRPMTEAYFFGEPEAVRRAGAVRGPILVPSVDLEEFRTDDPDYRTHVGKFSQAIEYHEGHPKRYLTFLTDPTMSDKKNQYKETKHGVAALRALNWKMILEAEGSCPYLRSIILDLAEMLGVESPVGVNGLTNVATFNPGKPSNVLRNC